MLLGYPSGQPGQRRARSAVSSPFDAYTHYFGGYAQDDWRVSPKSTMNYGVRLEHETGLREKNNGFTVAFDRTLNPGGALGNVVNRQRPAGPRRPGLRRRQNGANEYQGDPPAMKFSPRLGMVYSFNPKTVVRAGYGIYWAPWNYQAVEHDQLRQHRLQPGDASSPRASSARRSSLDQPVPERRAAAGRQRARRADRRRQPDRVHRPGQDGAVGAAVLGRHQPRAARQHRRRLRVRRRDRPRPRSRRHRTTASSTSTRCRSQYLALGAGAERTGAEPVLRPAGRPGLRVTSPTIPRRELLRPFPQFGNITTVGQARDRLLHGRRRDPASAPARRRSAAAWRPRTSTRTSTSR